MRKPIPYDKDFPFGRMGPQNGIAGASVVFYDDKLFMQAKSRAGFLGEEPPKLDYPFVGSWSQKAWNKIIDAAREILEEEFINA